MDHIDPSFRDVDTIVVVGDTEFHHNSFLLQRGSDYFKGMFAADMREAKTRRVEFPDEDPEDWKVVSLYFEVGVAPPVINESNVRTLLRWFRRLCMTHPTLNEACDQVYHKKFSNNSPFMFSGSKAGDINEVLDALAMSCEYGLIKTMRTCSKTLRIMLGPTASLWLIAKLADTYEYCAADLARSVCKSLTCRVDGMLLLLKDWQREHTEESRLDSTPSIEQLLEMDQMLDTAKQCNKCACTHSISR